MSERLTVVFDDDTLYRRLKMLAAETHVPLKRIVEDAVRTYLGPELPDANTFDWAMYDKWQAEVELLNDEVEASKSGQVLSLPVRFVAGSEREPMQMMGEEQAKYVVDP